MPQSSTVIQVVGVALVALALICPPWTYTHHRSNTETVRKPAGHHFLFYAPAPKSVTTPASVSYYGGRTPARTRTPDTNGVEINLAGAALQVAAALFVFGAFLWFTGAGSGPGRRTDPEPPPSV